MPNLVEILGGFSGAKLRLLMLAGAFVVAGFGLNVGSYLQREESIAPASQPATSASPRPGLRADWSERDVAFEIQERTRTWGDAATGLGMSFIVAMIVASLLRAFLKTMATLALIGAVALFYLQSKGVYEPEWTRYFETADSFRAWALSQTESAKAFLQGYVPSMGAALVGFGFGLKR